MRTYTVLMRSDESTVPIRIEHRSEGDIRIGDMLLIAGRQMLVDNVDRGAEETPIVECRALWRLRLRDTNHRAVGAGWILNEQRHFGEVETLIFEEGNRYRLVLAEPEWPTSFDGSLIVEPHPLDIA
ncbi:MAG: hypothetical protein EXQ81_03825 [Thermoleophilia bacterium]|nr:hypothetical protein [Thermoleophilia bacterium]